MEHNMIAYCGLYCGHCYSRTHVAPAAKELKEHMTRQGFEDFGPYMPDFKEFWGFLTTLIDAEGCPGCRQNGGSPACAMRTCPRERQVEACPLCDAYPCDKFSWLRETVNYPMLEGDNLTMRENGLEAWGVMQQERRDNGFTYVEERLKRDGR